MPRATSRSSSSEDRDLAPRVIEPRAALRVALELLLEQAQLEREGDEPLLRAVVQVSFEPLALLATCFDDPRA